MPNNNRDHFSSLPPTSNSGSESRPPSQDDRAPTGNSNPANSGGSKKKKPFPQKGKNQKGNPPNTQGQQRADAAERPNASTSGGSAGQNASVKTSGSYASKSGSTARSDPLHLETFVVPGANFAPLTLSRHVFTEVCGLDAVSQAAYRRIVADNPGFARRVTLATYQWYNAIFIWSRALALSARNGDALSISELQFVTTMETTACVFDAPILRLAEGLGNTITTGGRNLLFRLAPRAYQAAGGCTGWFERIGANSHWKYAAYPCTAVYARRIMEELNLQGPAQADWHLPDVIQPVEEHHGFPTRNLLGYGPLVRPRPDALAFIQSSGVTGANFPSTYDCASYNRALMSAISAELQNTDTFKPRTPSAFTPTGSKAQLGVFSIQPGTPILAGGTFLDYNLVVSCNGALSSQIVGAAMTYLYRAHRSNVEASNPWCVYSFNDFLQVPAPWINSANTLRNIAHEPPELNLLTHQTVSFEYINVVDCVLDQMSQ